jgi:putative ubiquitin-RnfH superfamily antitoxin RatB of RatAB toxin-antitoxin module
MANAESIAVEVAYARPDEQVILRLELPAGSTLRQAVEQSGILDRFEEIDPDNMKAGIFGKLKKADQVLAAGDRVEIYRPLIADPKEVRKQRAAAGKPMKKGGGPAGPEQAD